MDIKVGNVYEWLDSRLTVMATDKTTAYCACRMPLFTKILAIKKINFKDKKFIGESIVDIKDLFEVKDDKRTKI